MPLVPAETAGTHSIKAAFCFVFFKKKYTLSKLICSRTYPIINFGYEARLRPLAALSSKKSPHRSAATPSSSFSSLPCHYLALWFLAAKLIIGIGSNPKVGKGKEFYGPAMDSCQLRPTSMRPLHNNGLGNFLPFLGQKITRKRTA